jgi:hypothetical protein
VLRHDLLAAAVTQHYAMLELEFTAGEKVSLSAAKALDLLKCAVASLTGRECSDKSDVGIRRAFCNAARLPGGVLLVVDNVHSEEQVRLLLKDLLEDKVSSNTHVIFTSRSQQPLGGGADPDVWQKVRGHCCVVQQSL